MTSSNKIVPIFASLLREVPPDNRVWEDKDKVFTAQEVLNAIADQAQLGVTYAQHILQGVMQGFVERTDIEVPRASTIDVSAPVRQTLGAFFKAMPDDSLIWVTMSKKFYAQDMPGLLEQKDEYITILIEDMMRITRDYLAGMAGNNEQ